MAVLEEEVFWFPLFGAMLMLGRKFRIPEISICVCLELGECVCLRSTGGWVSPFRCSVGSATEGSCGVDILGFRGFRYVWGRDGTVLGS